MKNEETLFLFAKAIKSLIKKQPLDKITVTDIVSEPATIATAPMKNQTNILSTFSR